ncbi:hypothetical protein TSUD_289800 [Trifolium subterraneum]|uniref:Retrotransposon gag domain-containing protein n=1 Tax=Trifolium subterraneum TaxID=3900 RepID=A0A2Z6N5Z5_TRISU|nr:hypothetical protein TSUD_289800 [Trifolium subterraneum]
MNTKVHLKKFDAKAYKGIFIGYSECSKAYRVYNSETHTVEETVHIKFDDKQPDKVSELVENFSDLQLSEDDDSEPEETSEPPQPISEEVNSPPETLDSEDHSAPELISTSPSRVEQPKHTFKYKSSHPEELILGNKDIPRKTRSSLKNEDSLFGLISLVEPSTIDEALVNDAWIVAMQEELNQFERNEVWSLVPKPSHKNIIGTKWVYRNKLNEQGEVVRNKASLVAQGRKKVVRELIFDPEIETTAKANIKAVRLAHQAARLASGTEEILEEEVPSPNTSDNETESMAGVVQPPRRTLGDYGQTTDGQNPNLGFQPVNPVSFDIKNTVLNALKENQYSGAESECPNIHLSHFYEACGYTDPPGISESDKRLRLFKLSLTGRAKDWIDTLPSGTITSWDELELKFRRKNVVRELIFDPKIEKTAKANRKAVRLAHQAALLASGTEEILEEEVPSSNTSNDETESMAGVDPPPRRTLARFYEACGYTDPTGVSESNKKLRLFPLSLTGRAKDWIDTLPPNTIATWDELELKFRERYFPIHKFLERRNDITNFEQGDSESLYDAWERFKLCLKKCPKHGLDNHAQMQHFTQGLRAQTRMGAKKKAGMLELDTQTALLAQSQLMNTQMAAMLKHFTTAPAPQMQANAVQDVKCVFCGKGHANGECFPAGSEQAMYLSNFKKSSTTNNPYSNTYNPGWRDHPNFGWGGNQNQSQQQAPSQNSQPRQQSPLEDALAQFIKVTQGNFEEMKISQNQLKANQEQMKANQDIANKNHEASIKSVETQIGQLSRQFAATQNKGFEGSTKDNPRNESCMAINLRSREVPSLEVVSKKKGELRDEGVNESEGEVEKEWEIVAGSDNERDELVENQREKKIMPVYAKFMKELLTKKRKPLDDETVNMTEECSAIIQKKLPQKKKDPGSFTIPCSIGNLHVRRALCDLGASINLMPLSMKKRIPGAVAKPTKMQLSLVDRSITHPYGILQNVLVRCAEFVFPVDFVILDMEEDAEFLFYWVFEATTFGGPVPECFKVDVLEEVVNDAQEEEWEHEIELFLQNLDDEGKEEEPLNLVGALFTEALKKDDGALVWDSDGINSPFCLHKKTKEEEVKTSGDAYLCRVAKNARSVGTREMKHRAATELYSFPVHQDDEQGMSLHPFRETRPTSPESGAAAAGPVWCYHRAGTLKIPNSPKNSKSLF